MAAAITITPAAPTSILDSARIDCTGLDDTTEVYIDVAASGVDDARSQTFVGAADGTGLLFERIFPSPATYTVTVKAAADDSVIATTSVVVA
jgi:hypothetical protein